MSNVELSAPERTLAPPRRAAELTAPAVEGERSIKARFARAFFIQLCVRELQLSGHVASWLRVAARQLVAADMPALSAECIRLAAETWEQREQLTALAYRLVARRNRGLGRRRINVQQLLEEPPSAAMRGFIELNEELGAAGAGAELPGGVLASLSAVEQLLTGTVPLAIDIADLDHRGSLDDLAEVRELYEARVERASAMVRVLAELEASDPARPSAAAEIRARAIEAFTEITRESAELARQLDGWRRSAS